MSDQPPILTVNGLCAFYGRSQILFDVSLQAPNWGAIAVLGRNGAGKTTLLKTIAGELPAPRGTIELDGVKQVGMRTEHRIRGGLGYVPQEHGVFGTLTVRENLLVGTAASSQYKGKADLDRVLAIFPKLGDRLTQIAGTLSGGERKMLAISRALLGDPRLLLLDEPTEGVWPAVIDEIAEQLKALSSTVSLLIVEQHLELAFRLADYAYVMDRGRIAMEGASEEVRDDPMLLRYLAP